jgi:hypothetical protein
LNEIAEKLLFLSTVLPLLPTVGYFGYFDAKMVRQEYLFMESHAEFELSILICYQLAIIILKNKHGSMPD